MRDQSAPRTSLCPISISGSISGGQTARARTRSSASGRLLLCALSLCTALATLSWVPFAGAQGTAANTVAEEPTPTPLPQRGLLSRSSTFGYSTKTTPGVWGAEGAPSESGSPITGSISKKSDREWVARLFNNSEDIYVVSVEVKQMNAQGKRERSDSFSARLGPNESAERSLSATARTVDAQLELRSWKNLSEKKRQADEAAAAKTTAALRGSTSGATAGK